MTELNPRTIDEIPTPLRKAYTDAETLVAKLHTMRRKIQPDRPWLREERAEYRIDKGRRTEDELEGPTGAPW